MKLNMMIGVVLILVGGFILARGLSYSTKKDVVDLGVVRVSTTEKKSIPPWIGGVVAVVGLGLVFAGGSRKS